MDESSALVPYDRKLPKTQNVAAIRRNKMLSRGTPIGHLTFEDVKRLIETVRELSTPANRTRNALLVRTLYDSCCRCSEVLGIRPIDIAVTNNGARVRIIGKGNKPGEAAISASLANELLDYSHMLKLERYDYIWPINRRRVHQIVSEAMKAAGIAKPPHVGSVHVLRHSGALERLKRTGNPRALQHQLRHSSPEMTLRYQKTLEVEASLAIQSEVEMW